MVYPLSYRRPTLSSLNSLDEKTDPEGSIRSEISGQSAGIPDALAFDQIINGGTCPVSILISQCIVRVPSMTLIWFQPLDSIFWLYPCLYNRYALAGTSLLFYFY